MGLYNRVCSGPFQKPFEIVSICPFSDPVSMIYFEKCHDL